MAELNVPESMTAPQALTTLRILWGAMFVGEIVAAGVILGVFASDPLNANSSLRQLLFLIAVGLLCVLVPVGLFVRNQTYKAHWRGPVVTPNGYVKGNLILFAMLEGFAFVSLVLMAVAGFHWGLLAVAAAAVLVQLANFPNGKPMEPRGPSLPEPEKL